MTGNNTKFKTLIGQRLENMAHELDPMHRYGDNPRTVTSTPTVEQFLRGGTGDAQTWSPRSYASSSSARSQEIHDPEDIHNHSKKSTVLARVKEKARRWRNNFLKKKNSEGEGDNTTPTWGVKLEDDEDYEEEDPEYLGAPMYESELAPEGYKEHARQNPRAVPVISEKHVLASSDKSVSEQGKKEPTIILAETKAKKLPAPPNASGIDATQKIGSKIQGLFVSAPTAASETEKHATHETNKRAAHKTSKNNGTDYEADNYATREAEKHALKTAYPPLSPRENKWDKGVSVKEYIMNKFEPGEDEKALSQVISDAISPRGGTSGDVGVMEKVKGAVNSLLWKEEPAAQSTMKQSDTNSSSHIPISTNAQAVMKEDNKGRILQTN